MAKRHRGRAAGWREVVPGFGLLGILLVVSAATFFLDTIRRMAAEGPHVYVATRVASGLKPGSDVWVGGKRSGRVREVRFAAPGPTDTARVIVEVVLRKDAMPELRTDSRVTIGPSGLLAPWVVKFYPGSAGAPRLRGGDTLFVHPLPDIDDFLRLARSMREELGAFKAADERYREIRERGDGSAARFLADPRSLVRLDSARVRSARIAAGFRDGGGLPRILRDDSLRAAAARTREALRGLREMPLLASLPDSVLALSDAMASVAERAERIGAGLDEARGTAGRAGADPALEDRIEETREALRILTAELAANPFAWLRIRIF